jgi:hypothetical protein
MLERPKAAHMHAEREYNDVHGRLKVEPVRIMGATTELGGRVHQWQDPKTGKWSTGSADPVTHKVINYARNAFTQFRTYYSNSFNDHPLYTEQSEGNLVIFLDTRTHHGHDLEDNGARVLWRHMHAYRWKRPSGNGYVRDSLYHNDAAFFQQQIASYENYGEFFHNVSSSVIPDNYYAISNLTDRQSTDPLGTLNPTASFKHYRNQDNLRPRFAGSPISAQEAAATRVKQPFNDFGNIPNYFRGTISRTRWVEKFHYFSPKNNMHNSASTGGHPAPGVSMSGYSPAELANGFYRSGLRPVSKSYERAEIADFRPRALENLFYNGCKLVGSDFNMPVLDTADGGPVVEYTDTSPNKLMIVNKTSAGGDIVATAQQTRGV